MQTQSQHAGSASALLGVLSLLMGGVVSPIVGLLGNDSTLSMTSVILGAGLCAMISYILLRKK